MRFEHIAIAAVLGLVACASTPAEVEKPKTPGLDWSAFSENDVIEILTVDEDGDPRETKVWFVTVEGETYLRTSASRWLENIRRDPKVRIRIEGAEYEQRASEVTTPELIESVDEASSEKYGWQNGFISAFRTSEPQILKLQGP